jgi:hypothetical protein
MIHTLDEQNTVSFSDLWIFWEMKARLIPRQARDDGIAEQRVVSQSFD